MKLSIALGCAVLSYTPLATAVKCTSDTATALNYAAYTDNSASDSLLDSSSFNSDSSSADDLSDSAAVGSTVSADANAAAIAAIGQCNSQALIDDSECVSSGSSSSGSSASDLIKRATTLDCSSDEMCINLTGSDVLVCLNSDTGTFKDNSGGSGNILTGIYTAADGSSANIASLTAAVSATATGTATSTRTSATSTSTAAEDDSASETSDAASSTESAAEQSGVAVAVRAPVAALAAALILPIGAVVL